MFQHWKKLPDGNSYLVCILGVCHLVASSFDVVFMSFVFMSDNSVAYYLARKDSSYSDFVWVEEVPLAPLSLVISDAMTSMSVYL